MTKILVEVVSTECKFKGAALGSEKKKDLKVVKNIQPLLYPMVDLGEGSPFKKIYIRPEETE